MKRKKKILRFFSSLVLIVFFGLLIPNTVRADGGEDNSVSYNPTAWNATINGSTGNWTISHSCTLDLTNTSLPNDAATKQIIITGTGVSVTIKGVQGKTFKNLIVEVSGGASVTIDNLNITNDDFNNSPIIAVDSNSDNKLKFSGINNIRSDVEQCPGIRVQEPNSISILGEDSACQLNITGKDYGAGIGGGNNGSGGTIAIGGSGIVTATGGKQAAGIGGGRQGSGGTITIRGSGTVTAAGGEWGAGIGGGYFGSGGTIIRGGSGTVTATGGNLGAGIGGGVYGSGGTITIGGSGTVTATGGNLGAGIGGGGYENRGTTTIEGSVTVTATGGRGGPGMPDGAGIGGDIVTIGSSGTVTAIKGDGTEGIAGNATILRGVAPTVIGLSDGKIIGTTAGMQYKVSSASDSSYTSCTGTEINGLLPGDYSVKINSNIVVTVSVPESNVPAAPTDLVGEAPTVIGLSNGKITGITENMEYKVSSAPDSNYISCPGTEIDGLLPGSYCVRVKAAGGNIASAVATVTVPSSNVPAAPTNLAVTVGVLKVKLSWDIVPGATGYKVYKSTTQGSEYQLISDNISTISEDTSRNKKEVTVTGLTAGTTYYFVVKASKDGIDSADSSEVSSTPQRDTEKPVIHLNGASPVNLAYGSTYNDEGVTASDNVDGDITARIEKTITNSSVTTISAITTTQPGTYTIHYNVSDAAGNTAEEVTRTVIVQAYIPPYTPPYIPPYIPPVPQPVIENRQASVVIGKRTALAQVTVTRTTDTNCTKKDSLIFDENTAEKIVKEVLAAKTTSAAIDIAGISGNAADVIDIQLTKASSERFAANSIALNLQTEKASFYLTPETLAKLKDKDVEIKISKEKDSSETENTKALILRLASGAQIISDTLKIEANYTGRTKITIPIDSSKLPKDKEELDKFLASLAVMIHHSDGEDVLDKGTIVYDEKGNVIGISIWIDKFSSFTLVEIPKDYFQGKTTVMKDKVAADKQWNIKFTKVADAATVTKDNVHVADSKGNKVDVKISYGSDNVLTVTPVNPYTSGETYYMYVSKNVKAKDRTSLVNDMRYKFTVK